jgi:hypothetical protein
MRQSQSGEAPVPDDEKLQQRAAEIVAILVAEGSVARVRPTGQSSRQTQAKIHLELPKRAYALDLYYSEKKDAFTLYCAHGDEALGVVLGLLSTRWPRMKMSLPAKAASVEASRSTESALRAVEQLRQTCHQHGVQIDREKAGGGINSGVLTLKAHWNSQSTKATVSIRESQEIRFGVFPNASPEFTVLLEDLWAISRTRYTPESTLSRLGGLLAELAPYRDCRLDLLPLLMPLRSAAPDQELPDALYRFDFDKLEEKYREITENK